MSHLLQMRGLKLLALINVRNALLSHLLQMRGLKLLIMLLKCLDWKSHLLQMRGLKRYRSFGIFRHA